MWIDLLIQQTGAGSVLSNVVSVYQITLGPETFTAFVLLGFLMVIVSGFWMIALSYQKSMQDFILYMLIPFYCWYFFLRYIQKTWKPGLLWIGGVVISAGAIMADVFGS